MASKQKWYVVWEGRKKGVFDSWEQTQKQIKGFKGASFKSFSTLAEAKAAFSQDESASKEILCPSIAVDAACSGNPGWVEYRGVWVKNQEEIFHVGPLAKGTNNIGEFLALVHGIAYQKKESLNLPIYTDSKTARAWLQARKCKTSLKETSENKAIFDLLRRALSFLNTETFRVPILTWNTALWGEIPADFGRK